MNQYERQPEETRVDDLERDIESTRERMSRDLDALGEKLSPSRLAEEAASGMRRRARMRGRQLGDFVRENSLAVVAAGLGATWFFVQRSRGPVSGNRMARYSYTGPERRAGGLAGTAGELASQAKERAGDLGEEARERARRAGGRLERLMEDSPLALVAGAAVLGLAVGLAIPETRREEELMGPMRDRLAERAEAALERAKEAAGEVAETVRSEAAEQGRQAKGGVREAAEHVGRKVKESAQEVVREATRPPA